MAKISYCVNEMFTSISGEITGYPFGNEPAIFIRMQGCNLRCPYCDTASAQMTEGDLTPLLKDYDTVVKFILEQPEQLVIITGGEPLMQPNLLPLITAIAYAGKRITIYTNGTIYPEELLRWRACGGQSVLRFVVDLKSDLLRFHASGADYGHWFHQLEPVDVIKYPIQIQSERQTCLLCEFLRTHRFGTWRAILALSPIDPVAHDENGEYDELLQFITANHNLLSAQRTRAVTVSIQLHKLIGAK